MPSLLFEFGFVIVVLCVCAKGSTFDEIIDMVNSANLGWKAGLNFHPDTPEGFLRGLCGSRMEDLSFLPVQTYSGETKIPDEFDARKQWPNCPTISHVLDQGDCGSCWAFGSTSAFSDRLCVATNGSFTLPLSEDDVNSCMALTDDGCDGGFTSSAWLNFADIGVVTGGDYKSNVGCRTYEIPHCDHHVNGSYPPCPKSPLPAPACEQKCNNPEYTTPFPEDKHKADFSTLTTYADNKAAQESIMKHGPITTAFAVLADFLHYKSGIYQPHPGAKPVGRHAVRVIGWGTENGTPYWLIVNSWNTDWGDKGLFKIRRGEDVCGIESGMLAGLPLLN